MKNKLYFLFSAVWLAFLAGCSGVSGDHALRQALELAADNRPQLEKVLEHYKDDPPKRKAAEFLISNMPGHGSYTGKITERYYAGLLEALPETPPYIMISLFCLLRYYIEPDGLSKQEDVQVITAEFLIGHIDRQFDLYESLPWKEKVSFSEFCEYILPYRIADEPLEYILKHPLQRTFLSAEDSLSYLNGNLAAGGEFDILSFFDAQNDTREIIEQYRNNYKYPYPINEVYFPECISIAYKEQLQHRMMGVPGAFDFVPAWPHRNNRHYWFTPYHQLEGDRDDSPEQAYAKVYRQTYSRNDYPRQENGEYIPELLNTPFLKDVTDLYTETRDVSVDLINLENGLPNTVYLAVFNQARWVPVGWAARKKSKAHFEKMGTQCIYVPVSYRHDEPIYCGLPFYLDNSRGKVEFRPDAENKTTVCLTRKYPLADYKKLWSEQLVGLEVHVSDYPDFREYINAGSITAEHHGPLYGIRMDQQLRGRYWRIYNRGKSSVNIAELIFHGEERKTVQGEFMLPAFKNNQLSLAPDVVKRLHALQDNDPLTYTFIGEWIGVDFQVPVQLSEVSIMPRNDDNYVYPGQQYELFYFNVNGWQSLGKKTAADFQLTWANIPSNAVYWLRNHTKGNEERIFTLCKEEIRWW